MHWLGTLITQLVVDAALLDEERELLAEQARRLKLRNDLLEGLLARRKAREGLLARRKAREERRNTFRPVAVWERPMSIGSTPVRVLVELRESETARSWLVKGVTVRATGAVHDMSLATRDKLTEMLQLQPAWTDYINPWFHGRKTIKSMCKHSEIRAVGGD